MMKSKKSNRAKGLQTQTLELDKKTPRWKIFLLIAMIALAIVAFGYGINALFSKEAGWTEIEVDSTSELNCGEDFVLMYNLGASGTSSTVEHKALKKLYSEASMKAYQYFTNDSEYEGIHNIAFINSHPNEKIVVDEVLYEAFEVIQKYENRNIYLAPIYTYYDDIFMCNDDSETVDYNPYVNEEIATYYSEVASYAADTEKVNLELLGDNTVRLFVSEEYLRYAKENYIEDFIDFFWMKNAFVIDYLADLLIEKGYTNGSISSYDGYSRNLDESDSTYSFNIYDKNGDKVYFAAEMQCAGNKSIVYLRDYPLNNPDSYHYYEFNDGTILHSYLSVEDGKCKNAAHNLVSYSEETGCAEVLMQILPLYVTEEELDEQALTGLQEKGLYSVYCKDNMIYYNDSDVTFSSVYQAEDVTYETNLIDN